MKERQYCVGENHLSHAFLHQSICDKLKENSTWRTFLVNCQAIITARTSLKHFVSWFERDLLIKNFLKSSLRVVDFEGNADQKKSSV
jgi:hypothetical protein